MQGWGIFGWIHENSVARPISRTWRRNFESSLAVRVEHLSTIRFFRMFGCFRQEGCGELYLEEAAGRVGGLQTGAGSADLQ